MARARNTGGDLDAIASERAKLQQRMAELDAAERAAREAQRDAGRGVFLAALDKVKIGAMDRAQARALQRRSGSTMPPNFCAGLAMQPCETVTAAVRAFRRINVH
jgi:multidrug efflux pump subunit AcrA (membrane-fusion protein)